MVKIYTNVFLINYQNKANKNHEMRNAREHTGIVIKIINYDNTSHKQQTITVAFHKIYRKHLKKDRKTAKIAKRSEKYKRRDFMSKNSSQIRAKVTLKVERRSDLADVIDSSSV